MKLSIENLSYEVIAQLRLPQLLHRTLLRNQLTIMMYHAVVRSPLEIYDSSFLHESSFRTHIEYFKKYFDVIPLSEAVERMRSRRIYRPTAVITFDDGFQNNYDIAFPILREAGLPATIFLTAGLVNTSDTLWFCRLTCALAQTSRLSLQWGDSHYDLSGPESKAEAVAAIAARLKKFAQPQLLAELRRITLALDDDPDCPIEVDSPYRMLSHEAIVDMAASGLIEFGAHTHTHAILSRLSQKQRCEEIERSIAAIHQLTGRPCELFAYPNGHAGDYDAEIIRLLEARGVRTAVTGIPGPNVRRTPPMELKRYGVGADRSMAYFQLTVHHFIAYARQVLQQD